MRKSKAVVLLVLMMGASVPTYSLSVCDSLAIAWQNCSGCFLMQYLTIQNALKENNCYPER